MPHETRAVRAVFDDATITVYQAYGAAIALPAVDAQRFVPPFKRDRMTWVKPSFLWMMYRSGWATKEGQEHVLAVRLRRAGFDAAVAGACLSHYSPACTPTVPSGPACCAPARSASSGTRSATCGCSRWSTGRCNWVSAARP